jgi:MOSC domain-containing protein YiiM
VQERRLVRRLNIDGDAQGDLVGHGGEHRAVFVYQFAGRVPNPSGRVQWTIWS